MPVTLLISLMGLYINQAHTRQGKQRKGRRTYEQLILVYLLNITVSTKVVNVSSSKADKFSPNRQILLLLFKINFNIILKLHVDLPSELFAYIFPTKNCMQFSYANRFVNLLIKNSINVRSQIIYRHTPLRRSYCSWNTKSSHTIKKRSEVHG